MIFYICWSHGRFPLVHPLGPGVTVRHEETNLRLECAALPVGVLRKEGGVDEMCKWCSFGRTRYGMDEGTKGNGLVGVSIPGDNPGRGQYLPPRFPIPNLAWQLGRWKAGFVG